MRGPSVVLLAQWLRRPDWMPQHQSSFLFPQPRSQSASACCFVVAPEAAVLVSLALPPMAQHFSGWEIAGVPQKPAARMHLWWRCFLWLSAVFSPGLLCLVLSVRFGLSAVDSRILAAYLTTGPIPRCSSQAA